MQEVQVDELRKSDRATPRKWPKQDPNTIMSAVSSASLDHLRVAICSHGKFLRDKIDWHRTRGGRFHNERAAAYDTALQELLSAIEDA